MSNSTPAKRLPPKVTLSTDSYNHFAGSKRNVTLPPTQAHPSISSGASDSTLTAIHPTGSLARLNEPLAAINPTIPPVVTTIPAASATPIPQLPASKPLTSITIPSSLPTSSETFSTAPSESSPTLHASYRLSPAVGITIGILAFAGIGSLCMYFLYKRRRPSQNSRRETKHFVEIPNEMFATKRMDQQLGGIGASPSVRPSQETKRDRLSSFIPRNRSPITGSNELIPINTAVNPSADYAPASDSVEVLGVEPRTTGPLIFDAKGWDGRRF